MKPKVKGNVAVRLYISKSYDRLDWLNYVVLELWITPSLLMEI
jgi:hypothetical protein